MGPDGLDDGPAWYSGYVFLHTERWTADRWGDPPDGVVLGGQHEGIPLDIVVPLGDVYCGNAEDAGYFTMNDYYQITGYPECDGVDNDLDGEVDKGAPDEDGDGVADCWPKE